VTNTGLIQHSGSFAQFFTKYLSAGCSSVKCATSILTNLCHAPYNVAFGLWWLMNPPEDNPIDICLTEKYFGKVQDIEK
jgi:hypothetical protein